MNRLTIANTKCLWLKMIYRNPTFRRLLHYYNSIYEIHSLSIFVLFLIPFSIHFFLIFFSIKRIFFSYANQNIFRSQIITSDQFWSYWSPFVFNSTIFAFDGTHRVCPFKKCTRWFSQNLLKKKNDFFHNAKKNAFGSVFSKKKKKTNRSTFYYTFQLKNTTNINWLHWPNSSQQSTSTLFNLCHVPNHNFYLVTTFMWFCCCWLFAYENMCLFIYIFENIHSSYNVFFVATYLIVHRLVRTDVDAKRKRINCSVRFFFCFCNNTNNIARGKNEKKLIAYNEVGGC